MGSHINKDGEFQSDKYPTCPPGKVPLSVKDKRAQDLLWEYAQRRRSIDPQFSSDLELALKNAGYNPLNDGKVCPRCYEPATHVFLDGYESKRVCINYPKCEAPI